MMTQKKSANSDFLNGVPELLILSLLEKRPVHGYELVRWIRESTGDPTEFGESAIYPILHRLKAAGMLDSEDIEVAKRPRTVYRLTQAGIVRLAHTRVAWNTMVQMVSKVLKASDETIAQTA
jgi:PadR family transcriptional regulator PadR